MNSSKPVSHAHKLTGSKMNLSDTRLITKHTGIQQPKTQTVSWNTNLYTVKNIDLEKGELILRKREKTDGKQTLFDFKT